MDNIIKNIKKYNMLRVGDRVAVACSGGKDSMCLLNFLWTHKDELANKLRNGIVDCISRGVSKDELTKELMRIYGTEFYKADRIARTELNYV